MTEATVNCALVKGMFSDCSALKKVNLGNDVTRIPDEFFKGTALEEFTIGSAITYIGSSAFENCTKLTSMTIPDNVNIISLNAFAGCTGLISVTYSGTPKVTAIYDGTFKNCSGLTSFTIPASVTAINANAFDGCTRSNHGDQQRHADQHRRRGIPRHQDYDAGTGRRAEEHWQPHVCQHHYADQPQHSC